MACPASIPLHDALPKKRDATVYSAEGTAAHTLASRALEYGRQAAFFLGEEIEADGFVFKVDEAMAEAVQVYLDEVRRRLHDGATLMFEQRVWFSETIGVPDQGGTSDCIILHKGCTALTIGDLKYGMGEPVSADENRQMMTYALGVLETFDTIMEEVDEVTLFISQPRLDSLTEWTCSRERLMQHRDEMRTAAAKARLAAEQFDVSRTIDPSLYGVTEKGCRWCKIKATCDAYRQHVSKTVFDDFEVLDDPARLEVIGQPAVPGSPDRLGQLFGHLGMIEDWCRSVRAEVERLIFGGMTVIGPDGLPMKLIEGRKGHRKWSDVQAAEATLVPLLGQDAYTAPELLTPAAVEKKLGKKRKQEFEDFLAPLTTQSRGAAKVALGSDPAPPYQEEASADEFTALDD